MNSILKTFVVLAAVGTLAACGDDKGGGGAPAPQHKNVVIKIGDGADATPVTGFVALTPAKGRDDARYIKCLNGESELTLSMPSAKITTWDDGGTQSIAFGADSVITVREILSNQAPTQIKDFGSADSSVIQPVGKTGADIQATFGDAQLRVRIRTEDFKSGTASYTLRGKASGDLFCSFYLATKN